MGLQSLMLSRDAEVLRVMRRVLDEYGIEVEVCADAAIANQTLAQRKFDAVFVDCDDVEGAHQVLTDVRKGASNKRSVVLAIVNGVTTMRAAFEMGANFVLDKPLTVDRMGKSVRVARGSAGNDDPGAAAVLPPAGGFCGVADSGAGEAGEGHGHQLERRRNVRPVEKAA
jgi:DNA-binding NtrC family response regulator